MDSLKRFLQEHRAQVDGHSPAPDVKAKLFYSLGKRRKKTARLYPPLVAAATVAAIIFSLFRVQDGVPADKAKGLIELKKDPVTKVTSMDDKKDVRMESGIEELTAVVDSQHAAKMGIAQAPLQPLDEEDPFSTSYTSQIDQQVARLNVLPLFAAEPASLMEKRRQFQILEEREKAIWKGKDKSNGRMMEELITLYQDKLSLLIKIKHEIIRINNALPSDSILLITPHYINL